MMLVMMMNVDDGDVVVGPLLHIDHLIVSFVELIWPSLVGIILVETCFVSSFFEKSEKSNSGILEFFDEFWRKTLNFGGFLGSL